MDPLLSGMDPHMHAILMSLYIIVLWKWFLEDDLSIYTYLFN